MQMLNDLFTGRLKKFNAKSVDGDVYFEVGITHISENEPDQTFLDNFSEEIGNSISKCLKNPEWDNIKFTCPVSNMKIKFDAMEIEAHLQSIKITQKETPDAIVFKYDLTFLKKQEESVDTIFSNYLNHKEEDDNGKEAFVDFDIEITQ